MTTTNPAVTPVSNTTTSNQIGELDIRKRVESTHTEELVIALCGPIGSPIHRVRDILQTTLEQQFDYTCKVIRLSEQIEKYKGQVSTTPSFDRVKQLIQKGNELRQNFGPGILAELAIHDISLDRQQHKEASGVNRFESRRICHIIDSIKNQEELDILKLVYRDILYFVGVFSPLSVRESNLSSKRLSLPQIHELIDQDSGEELAHGQTVTETFPQADFFLRVDSNTDAHIKAKVERFLNLILGTKVITPSADETAMYMAASAAGNSACLSRQVGAALTDEKGEMLAVGWNDVPKAGGNLYTYSSTDMISEHDKRCFNLEGGNCFNDAEKKMMSELLVSELSRSGIIVDGKTDEAIKIVSTNSKLKNLIEFSRAVHAEMHAIITGSQNNGGSVINGKLYCTTYPCHSCARHIIAAGIKEVYYIEPYRKSLALKLHSDAITENESDATKVRILAYDGVAPSRYMSLFKMMPGSRKRNGKLIVVKPAEANPKVDKSIEAMPTLEAMVVDDLIKRNIIQIEE